MTQSLLVKQVHAALRTCEQVKSVRNIELRRFMSDPILYHADYNPIPDDAAAGYADTADGLKIRYAQWKSKTYPVKGTVLLLHGRAEFIEKMFETVNDLRQSGFDVVTFDWRGQGGSDRLLSNTRKGYVDNFDQYTMDMEAIMEQVALPDCKAPYYVLAHSTGALIALYSAPRFSNRIRRMVFSSPFLGFGKMPISQNFLKYLTGTMSAIGLGEMFAAGGSKPFGLKSFAASVFGCERGKDFFSVRGSKPVETLCKNSFGKAWVDLFSSW